MDTEESLKTYEPFFGKWHISKLLKEYNDIVFADIIDEKNNHAVLKAIIVSNPTEFGNMSYNDFLDKYEMKDLNDLEGSPYLMQESYFTEEELYLIIFFMCRSEWIDEDDPDNPDDLYNLGCRYLYGKERVHNEYRGTELIWKAAKKDLPAAQNKIGECYEDGYGVEINFDKAIYWFEKAAGNNDKKGLYNLGKCYLYGEGIEKDPELGVYYLKQAANYGLPEAIYLLGECYLQGNGIEENIDKAFKCMRKTADDLNNGIVFYNLGKMYEDGNGTEPNMKEAFKCYEKSAALDYSDGLFALAECYNFGEGVEKDKSRAFQCLKRASDIGDERLNEVMLGSNQYYGNIKYLLGQFYFLGEVTEQDYEKAFECFIIAYGFDSWDASNYLGKLFHYGLGIDQDYKEAIEHYNIAAKHGVGEAIYNLGVLYATAPEEYNDINKAFDYFKFIYDKGFIYSGLALGLCYVYGRGVEIDEEKGLKIIKNVAQTSDTRNNEKSAYCVGYCYQNGIGTKIDLDKAKQWYTLSLNLGYNKAQEQIDIINRL